MGKHVHTLTGFTPSTGSTPTFKPVAQPEPRPQTRPRNDHHPDAEVIDLAERVKALGPRCDSIHARVQRLTDWVEAAHAPPPRPVTNAALLAHFAQIRPTEERVGLVYARKLRVRHSKRMQRWLTRLAALEASTMAGVAAKAETLLALRDLDWTYRHDDEIDALAVSQERDAVRLASLPQLHLGEDDKLLQLRDEWDASGARCSALARATCAALDRMTHPPVPDALHFRAATDETYIGQYQNRSRTKPHGYTDPEQIDQLRRLCSPAHHARRDEIVAAFDAWRTAVQDDANVSGYTAAAAAWDAEIDWHNEIERRIVRMPALSHGGLAAKMAVALWGLQSDDEVVTDDDIVEEIEYRIAKGVDEQSAALPWSILLDLKRMLSAGVTVTASTDDAPLLAAVAEFCRVDDLQDQLCRTHNADTDNIPGYAETEAPWHAWLERVVSGTPNPRCVRVPCAAGRRDGRSARAGQLRRRP